MTTDDRIRAEIMEDVARRLLTALESTGVGTFAGTDAPPAHSWVCRPDDVSICWCQFCGVHLIEERTPRAWCPALVLVRAALS